jgi:hypothetical protein
MDIVCGTQTCFEDCLDAIDQMRRLGRCAALQALLFECLSDHPQQFDLRAANGKGFQISVSCVDAPRRCRSTPINAAS